MGGGRGQREPSLREEPLIERQSDRERERIIFSSQSTAALCQGGRGACRQSSAPRRVTGCVVLTLDIVPTNSLRFSLRCVYVHAGYSTDRYPPLQSSFRLYSDWYSHTEIYINTFFIVLSVPSADGGVLASTKFFVSYTWSTRMGLPVLPRSTAIKWRRSR